MISNLQLTIAKLELKHLEMIDKLSEKNNDKVIRCITSPDTCKFLAVNGDWEKVTGFKEEACIGLNFEGFVPDYKKSIITKNEDGFISYTCELATSTGFISVDWKTKNFPEINATVSIGRLTKI